jgi:uracil-DNA glycosylase
MAQQFNNADDLQRYVLNVVHPEWRDALTNTDLRTTFSSVCTNIVLLMRHGIQCVPEPANMFRVLQLAPSAVRIIIMGQDPYPTAGMATGLAFSNYVRVLSGKIVSTAYAPSLLNIMEASKTQDSTLFSWWGQGVFLTNSLWSTTLGVSKDNAHNFWNPFVLGVLQHICDVAPSKPSAMLWGANAQTFRTFLQEQGVECYEFHHPSPLADNRVAAEHRWPTNPNFRDYNSSHASNPINWETRQFQYSWPRYLIFTDGGCVGNGNADARAGFGVAILERLEPSGAHLHCNYKLARKLSKPIEAERPTNNIAELTAIQVALAYPKFELASTEPFKIGIVTDSGYSINVLLGIFRISANVNLIGDICARQSLLHPIYSHTRGHKIAVPPAEMPTSTADYEAFFNAWNAFVDQLATAGIPPVA